MFLAREGEIAPGTDIVVVVVGVADNNDVVVFGGGETIPPGPLTFTFASPVLTKTEPNEFPVTWCCLTTTLVGGCMRIFVDVSSFVACRFC